MTYDELRAALSAAMHRNDPETIANEPTALELARAIVAVSFFPRESEIVLPAFAVTDGMAELPADFGRAAAVGEDLAYIAPRNWNRMITSAVRELRGKFTVYAGLLHVHPAVTSVAMVYNQQPAKITAGESNWLSEHYPSIWLYAAKAEQYRFIEDNESANNTDTYWRTLAQQLDGESERSRQSGGLIRMKSR